MKKLYSLFAAVILVASVNAQTTIFSEDFNDITGTGGNDGSWGGQIASTAATEPAGWTYENIYNGDKSLKAGTGKKAGSITTPALSNLFGVATLTFRAGAWDGTSEKLTLKLSIIGGGTLDKSSITMTKGAFSPFTVEITGGTAESKLKFEAEVAANNRFFIDDILVVSPTQAVGDVNATKVTLIKNTNVGNTIVFGAKANVQIMNVNGQVVKTATVLENTNLDVSSLSKGMYIVSGEVNGQKVSQKIIKN